MKNSGMLDESKTCFLAFKWEKMSVKRWTPVLIAVPPPAAVNNSLLKDKKSEFPAVFGRSSPTIEERFYGW